MRWWPGHADGIALSVELTAPGPCRHPPAPRTTTTNDPPTPHAELTDGSSKTTTAAGIRGYRRVVRKSLGALPSTGHRHSSDRPRRPGDGHPFPWRQETND